MSLRSSILNRPARLAAVLFLLSFAVYRISPVAELTDSNYTMLFAQNLWQNHRWDAQEYFRLPLDPARYPAAPAAGKSNKPWPYQVYGHEGKVYPLYLPGNVILCVPFALMHNILGISSIAPDQQYDAEGELHMQRNAAAVVTAGTVTLLFLLARLLISDGAAFLVALVAAFGTGLWSTASRVMWSHTWGLFLLSFALYLVLRADIRQRPLRPVLLGSLLAWLLFVRPNFMASVGAIGLYLLICRRKEGMWTAAVGAGWLALLLLFTWLTTGQLMPPYCLIAGKLVAPSIWDAAAGSFLSPSRGLLVFMPVTFAVIWLVARHGWRTQRKPLMLLALAGTALHFVLLAKFATWWAGHSYGARYGTDVVPWLALLAALSLDASRERATSAAAGVMAAILICLSFYMQAWGAWQPATLEWNRVPANVDSDERRCWDWRQPQFLAGLFTPEPQPPRTAQDAPVGTRFNIGLPAADPYFFWGYGWGLPEGAGRWTAARETRAFFRVLPAVHTLRLNVTPFLCPPLVTQQVVRLEWNHRRVADWVFDRAGSSMVTARLPATSRDVSELRFVIPTAIQPAQAGCGNDERLLGLWIQWVRFD